MKIAICDDEIIYSKYAKDMCDEYAKERMLNCDIVVFNSGEELLAYKEEINILLLDIQMNGINGITVKEHYEEAKKNTIIIFLTSYKELMQEAFGGRVFSFLTKPVEKERFYSAMDRVVKELESEFIVEIETFEAKVYINGNSIIYIKSEDKYTKVITCNGEYLVSKSMNYWEQYLSKYDFYRTHKSFLLNLAYIKKIEDTVVIVEETRTKLSRRNNKEFREIYYKYIKRKAK